MNIYSDTQMTTLAQSNPKELSRILTSPNTDVRTLTSGAEILGSEVTDETLVAPVLRILLKHVNALVREGAVIGTSAFYSSKKPPQDILERVRAIANNDPLPILKEEAKSLLEYFESKHEGS